MSVPPSLARRLGHGGLLPFVGGALLVWLAEGEAHVYAAMALAAYAALIVSFLGGIHWGLAMRADAATHSAAASATEPANVHLAWGVGPSLLAWPAVLMPAHAGLVLLGLLLLVCYAVDRVLYRRAGAAPWLTLRFQLSAIAALSCFVGAAGS